MKEGLGVNLPPREVDEYCTKRLWEFGTRFYIMNRGMVVAGGIPSELSAEMVHQHLSV